MLKPSPELWTFWFFIFILVIANFSKTLDWNFLGIPGPWSVILTRNRSSNLSTATVITSYSAPYFAALVNKFVSTCSIRFTSQHTWSTARGSFNLYWTENCAAYNSLRCTASTTTLLNCTSCLSYFRLPDCIFCISRKSLTRYINCLVLLNAMSIYFLISALIWPASPSPIKSSALFIMDTGDRNSWLTVLISACFSPSAISRWRSSRLSLTAKTMAIEVKTRKIINDSIINLFR